MKNIYEVFLKNNFNFVENAKLIKSILETATVEEKRELRKEMVEELHTAGEDKLDNNLKIFRKINFKLKHPQKKNMKYSFTEDDVKNFDFIYNELVSLAVEYLKISSAKKNQVGNVLYLIGIDQHTPNHIYELLKDSRNLIKVDTEIVQNFYWLSAPQDKLDQFKNSWSDVAHYNLAKCLIDVLDKVDESSRKLSEIILKKKKNAYLGNNKNPQSLNEDEEFMEKKLKQDATLGVFYLNLLEIYMTKEMPNNFEGKLRVEKILEKNVFKNYKESPFIINAVKKVAEAYRKIFPDGNIPALNKHNKKILNNLDFMFAINCKDVYTKNDFMNLLAQKNRNDNINREFKLTFNKKGMLKENSVLDVSQVYWHKKTSFEDIKRAFDFQGVPLSSKEWMIITLGADDKACSEEAICYLNERRYSEDVSENRLNEKVVIRPRVKF